MAVLYITEYAVAKVIDGRMLQAGVEPPVARQTVAIGGASAASSAFNAKTKFVELHTDAICSVRFAAAPVAVVTDMRMAADSNKFLGVGESSLKVAVIANT